jgi:hypothetical protein
MIFVPADNRADYAGRAFDGNVRPNRIARPVGETELLHEMMHEMQFSELSEPSPEGVALLRTARRNFAGPNHDELFYTAIARFANAIGMEPQRVADEL